MEKKKKGRASKQSEVVTPTEESSTKSPTKNAPAANGAAKTKGSNGKGKTTESNADFKADDAKKTVFAGLESISDALATIENTEPAAASDKRRKSRTKKTKDIPTTEDITVSAVENQPATEIESEVKDEPADAEQTAQATREASEKATEASGKKRSGRKKKSGKTQSSDEKEHELNAEDTSEQVSPAGEDDKENAEELPSRPPEEATVDTDTDELIYSSIDEDDDEVYNHESAEEAANYEEFLANYQQTIADMRKNAKSSADGASKSDGNIMPDYDSIAAMDDGDFSEDDINDYIELEEDDTEAEYDDDDEPISPDQLGDMGVASLSVFDAVALEQTDMAEDDAVTEAEITEEAPEEMPQDAEAPTEAEEAFEEKEAVEELVLSEEAAEEPAQISIPDVEITARAVDDESSPDEGEDATEDDADSAEENETPLKGQISVTDIFTVDSISADAEDASVTEQPAEDTEREIDGTDISPAEQEEAVVAADAEAEATEDTDGTEEAEEDEEENSPAPKAWHWRRRHESYDPEKPRAVDYLFDLVELLVLTLIAIVVISSFFVRHSTVNQGSMNTTLADGDHLLISNLFYSPDYGDIVVFDDRNVSSSGPMVKRIIALGGDTVSIVQTEQYNTYAVYVNGLKLDEDYVTVDGLYYSELTGSWTLAEDEVFVMGDHRNVSKDSREFGPIKAESILGEVILRIYPFHSFGTVE